MARLIGPDEASREVKAIVGKTFRSKDGSRAQLWSDDAATIPADVLWPDGSAIPVEQPANNGGRGSAPTVTIDGSSMLPLVQFPPGDVDVVYGTCDGGPAWPVYARTDDRLDAVKATADAAETPAGATAKASAAQAAAIAAVAGTGPLRAVDGRHYRMVLGVIRNNGGPSYWQALDDPNHRPHNIDSVATDTSSIVVNFASLGGTRVVSLVVFPDETLAAAGIMAGASVTAAAATITLSRPAALADYVFYNGSAWVSQNGIFTGLSFAAGVLSLTHPSMEDPGNPFTTYYGVSVTGRGPGLVAMVSGDSGGVTSTGLKVSWFDWAGTLQTAASAGMKAFITRSAPKAQAVNPQTVDTTKFPSSNLWIIGVVEV